MIVDDEEILTLLNLDEGTAKASLALRLRNRVERLVKKFVGYEIEQDTHVEILPQQISYPLFDQFIDGGAVWGSSGYLRLSSQGDPVLALSELPVRSVESVYQSRDQLWDAAHLLDPASYRLDIGKNGLCRTGFLQRLDSWWTAEPRSVQVSYTAGYTEEELDGLASDFREAVTVSVIKFYNERVANFAATRTIGTGAVAREKLDGSIIFYERAGLNSGLIQVLPQEAREILEGHVRMGVYL